jgi:hypothetical protein
MQVRRSAGEVGGAWVGVHVVGVSGCLRVLVGVACVEPPGGMATVDRVEQSAVNGERGRVGPPLGTSVKKWGA